MRPDDSFGETEPSLFFGGIPLSSRLFQPFVPPLLRRVRLLKYAARRNRAHDWHISFILPVLQSCYQAFPPPTYPVAYQSRVPRTRLIRSLFSVHHVLTSSLQKNFVIRSCGKKIILTTGDF